jgi:hypothetical protein
LTNKGWRHKFSKILRDKKAFRTPIKSKVIEPASMKDQRVSLSEDVIPNFNDICSDLANITEGMSGREIEKMCSNVYVSH